MNGGIFSPGGRALALYRKTGSYQAVQEGLDNAGLPVPDVKAARLLVMVGFEEEQEWLDKQEVGR